MDASRRKSGGCVYLRRKRLGLVFSWFLYGNLGTEDAWGIIVYGCSKNWTIGIVQSVRWKAENCGALCIQGVTGVCLYIDHLIQTQDYRDISSSVYKSFIVSFICCWKIFSQKIVRYSSKENRTSFISKSTKLKFN